MIGMCSFVVMSVLKAQHGHRVETEVALNCSPASKSPPEKKDYPTSEFRSQDVWISVKMELHVLFIQMAPGID
jgi:hypothetical protein